MRLGPAAQTWHHPDCSTPSCSVGRVVLACSALRTVYRDTLRRSIPGRVVFAWLDVDKDVLRGETGCPPTCRVGCSKTGAC
jgi:hypothetical protein